MRRWTRGRRDLGAAAIEYGPIVAVVATVAIVGPQVFDMYNTGPGF
jgi:Flp pilus assembly pilin Flp